MHPRPYGNSRNRDAEGEKRVIGDPVLHRDGPRPKIAPRTKTAAETMNNTRTNAPGPLVRGIFDAIGTPALVLFASMVGYGSMAHDKGLTLWSSVASTGLVWGLPGQIAMVELLSGGAPLIAIALAASAANARFLPMTLSVMPLFAEAPRRKWWRYVIAQFISLNPWAAIMREGPRMPPPTRPRYFAGFTLICIVAGMLGTGAGFLLSGAMPHTVSLSLVLLNPVYFTLIFVDARERGPLLAVAGGVVSGPVFHLLSPEWGLLITGVVAGCAAFAIDRHLGRRND